MSKIDPLADINNIVGAPTAAENNLNANFDEIEESFQNTLSRDGSTPNEMQTNLDMNSYRIINVLDGVDPQDVVTKSQLDEAFNTLGNLHGGIGAVVQQNVPGDRHATIDVNLTAGFGISLIKTVGNITISALAGGGALNWGAIGGTLSDQLDLQAALDGKAAVSHTHNASQIIGGTISDSQLSGNVVLENQSNSFGSQQYILGLPFLYHSTSGNNSGKVYTSTVDPPDTGNATYTDGTIVLVYE